MKWWKYCWAVIGNIIFIFILLAIFNNLPDSSISKVLAACVVIYLCVIGIGMQLSRQISSGFAATMLTLQSMVKHDAGFEATDEGKDFKHELDAGVDNMEKEIKQTNVKQIIHACFALIICIWMLTILLSGS